jgi:hypothetical protein
MIRITPGFTQRPESDDIPSFPPLSGGIRIEIDGTTLTELVDETTGSAGRTGPYYDPKGAVHDYSVTEFAGEDVGLSLYAICNAFEPFIDGTATRHKEYTREFDGEPGQILISFSVLDGEQIRVATLPRYLDGNPRLPAEAMVGRSVDPAAFGHELADCFEACLDFTRLAYVETERWADFTDAFAELRAEYEKQLEPLREVGEET